VQKLDPHLDPWQKFKKFRIIPYKQILHMLQVIVVTVLVATYSSTHNEYIHSAHFVLDQWFINSCVLCYAMVCVVLCYGVCCAMLWCVLCYAMVCVVLCYGVCCAVLRCVLCMLWYVVCYGVCGVLCCVMLCCVLCYAVLCDTQLTTQHRTQHRMQHDT